MNIEKPIQDTHRRDQLKVLIELNVKNKTELRMKIKRCEESQDKANEIMCNPNSHQSNIDAARVSYHIEVNNLSRLKKELTSEENRYTDMVREHSILQFEINKTQKQQQFDTLTINSLTKHNNEIKRSIVELCKKKTHPLERLDFLRGRLSELDSQNATRIDAEKLVLSTEAALSEGRLDVRLGGDKKPLEGLKKGNDDAKSLLAKAKENLASEEEYQKAREIIFERAARFKSTLADIDSEIEQLKIKHYANCSTIAQKNFISSINSGLQHLKEMIALDDLTNGKSKIGRDLFDYLTDRGISVPTPNGPSESVNLLKGLLDNLDEVKKIITQEFESNVGAKLIF